MNEPPTHIDLFSGIGGFALAARNVGLRTVVFCERDAYCQKVLAKNFGDTPIIPDIHAFDGSKYRGAFLLTGGFPCQPYSVAGKRKGAADDRALWPQMLRVIDEANPSWVLGENVAGIVQMELDRVLSDMESVGYACWPVVIPACAVDAKHRRDRVWILAHCDSSRRSAEPRKQQTERPTVADSSGHTDVANARSTGRREGLLCIGGDCEQQTGEGRSVIAAKPSQASPSLADNEGRRWSNPSTTQPQNRRRGTAANWQDKTAPIGGCSRGHNVPDANEPRSQGRNGTELRECSSEWIARMSNPFTHQHANWLPEPDVGRVANGIPHRVDRLKGLGNAIVPQVAEEIMRAMILHSQWSQP